MPSRMYWFNKEMFLQIGRSTGWISGAYLLGLLFALPIRILLNYSEENPFYTQGVKNLFSFDFGIQIGLYITIPVLMAIFLFRFLHVKQAADLMHSFPLKRSKIFHFYTFSGAIYLVTPVVIIAAIVLLLHSIYDLNVYFSSKEIIEWMGTVILFNLVIYISGIFIAMITGISAIQGVLTYIFLLFPSGITILILYTLDMVLYGFPTEYYQTQNIEKLSPLTHLTLLEYQSLNFKEISIYFLIIVIIYILAYFAYLKRNIEFAAEAIAFKHLQVLFKYGVTFCSMLVGGMYFNAVQHQFGWMIFGYSAGAIIGYFIAEMILQKTWRVYGNLKGLGAFFIVIFILILGIKTILPYEKKIPTLKDIQFVTFSNNIYFSDDSMNLFYKIDPIKEPKNIEAVIKLHGAILKNESVNKHDSMKTQHAFFIYQLKNGEKIIRQYEIDSDRYFNQLKEVYESREYIQATQPIFRIDPDKALQLRIQNELKNNKQITISDEKEIHEAIDILRNEVMKKKFDGYNEGVGFNPFIDILFSKDEGISLVLEHDYKEFISWLERKGLKEKTIVSPDDIEKIIVTSHQIQELNGDGGYSEDEVIQKIEAQDDLYTITEKEEVEFALNKCSPSWMAENGYNAVFYFNDGNRYIRTFKKPNIPKFIEEHFKR